MPAGVRRDAGFVIQRTAERDGTGYIISFQQRSRGRDERDPASSRESRRANEWF